MLSAILRITKLFIEKERVTIFALESEKIIIELSNQKLKSMKSIINVNDLVLLLVGHVLPQK